MSFDRLKIVEKEVVNQKFLFQKLDDLKNNKTLSLYFKINEGPDLNRVFIGNTSLIDFLNQFCENNKINKNLIKIESDNLSQEKLWPNYIKFFNSDPFLYGQNCTFNNNKKINKKFGLFIGGSRWPRLELGAYVYKHFKNDTLMTFNHSNFNINSYLKNIPIEFHYDVKELYSNLPIKIIAEDYRNGYINFDKAYELLPYYNEFFLDIVCETWHEGNCFMPTEKIGRALKTETPFIVYSGKNFLANLKKLNFKTFDNFWDESYDTYEGGERITKLKELIYFFGGKTNYELQKLYDNIRPICDHNQKIYQSLTNKSILEKFL